MPDIVERIRRGHLPFTMAELVARNRNRGRLLTSEKQNEIIAKRDVFDTDGRQIHAVLFSQGDTKPDEHLRQIREAIEHVVEIYPLGHLGDVSALLRELADELDAAVSGLAPAPAALRPKKSPEVKHPPVPPPPGATLLTVPETAHELRCSVATVYREIADGKLPTRRVRDKIYVHREDLVAYLDASRQEVRPAGESPVSPSALRRRISLKAAGLVDDYHEFDPKPRKKKATGK